MDEKEIDELLKEANLDADGQLNYTSMFNYFNSTTLPHNYTYVLHKKQPSLLYK